MLEEPNGVSTVNLWSSESVLRRPVTAPSLQIRYTRGTFKRSSLFWLGGLVIILIVFAAILTGVLIGTRDLYQPKESSIEKAAITLPYPSSVSETPTTKSASAPDVEGSRSHSSGLPIQSYVKKFRYSAVSSQSEICSRIGISILVGGGTAIEAAIATFMCTGAVLPQYTGLGASGIVAIFDHHSKSVKYFGGVSTVDQNSTVTVPVLVAACWGAYFKASPLIIEWSNLIKPTVGLCQRGVPISQSLRDSLDGTAVDTSLSQVFRDELTQTYKPVGSVFNPSRLISTLQSLEEGSDAYYSLLQRSRLSTDIIDDLSAKGFAFTPTVLAEHWRKYNNEEYQADRIPILGGKYTLHTCHRDSMRVTLEAVFSTLEGLNATLKGTNNSDIANSELSLLSALEPISQKHRKNKNMFTSNILIQDSNGISVTVSSSLNSLFGSKFAGKSTGIVFNDFGNSPSVGEMISPMFVTDAANTTVLQLGASGDYLSLYTAVATLYEHLYLGVPLTEAMGRPKLYPGDTVRDIQYGPDYPTDIVQVLANRGYHMTQKEVRHAPSVQAISSPMSPKGISLDTVLGSLSNVAVYSDHRGYGSGIDGY